MYIFWRGNCNTTGFMMVPIMAPSIPLEWCDVHSTTNPKNILRPLFAQVTQSHPSVSSILLFTRTGHSTAKGTSSISEISEGMLTLHQNRFFTPNTTFRFIVGNLWRNVVCVIRIASLLAYGASTIDGIGRRTTEIYIRNWWGHGFAVSYVWDPKN